MKREKIAILGGGMAALTAAFELTERPEDRARYEITVYQMGFRLGGKGASGRNRALGDRIEEHGLHILMGFYHNAFSVLRRCYAELGRAPGTPLATVEEAVVPFGDLAIMEQIDGRWEPWALPFPPLPGAPGVGPCEELSVWDYLQRLVAWMESLFADSPEIANLVPSLRAELAQIDDELRRAARSAFSREPERGLLAAEGPDDPEADTRPAHHPNDERARMRDHLTRMIDDVQAGRDLWPASLYLRLSSLAMDLALPDPVTRILWLLDGFRTWLRLFAAPVRGATPLRRLFMLLDLGLATVVGALTDRVDRAPDGWFSIDDLDFRAWLDKHGAAPETRDGALVRSLYNLAFTSEGKLAAGTIVNATLRLLFSYKGGIFQKMQAGMGDVVFAPLYQVLERRGVRFAFFHRVRDLVLSPSLRRVAAVVIGRQATVKGGSYQPLYDVDGLPCWPSEPDWDQLEEGAELRSRGEILESWWSDWPDVETLTLREGEDFDRVILGLSIGALPYVCRGLVDANERFAAMVRNVQTTQTQAVQLWMTPDLGALGWSLASPVLDAFAGPFDTWADMTHLLPHERWPREGGPRNLAYLCSHLDDDRDLPPGPDPSYVARQKDRVKDNAFTWLGESARAIWPATVSREGAFDWSLLHDPEGRAGRDRFEAQYWQATVSPSERYVRAVPGSVRYRLRAHESGFDNLVLAGDWVRTGLSVGCLEATVMSGMQASRAICGQPAIIPGDEP